MILYPFQPDLPFGYSVAGFDEEKKTPGAELYLLPPGAQIPAEFTGGAIFSEAPGCADARLLQPAQSAAPDAAGVWADTQVSGGSLEGYARALLARWGERLWMYLRPLCMRFPVPCPTGVGEALDPDEARTLLSQHPSHYSPDLVCRYSFYPRCRRPAPGLPLRHPRDLPPKTHPPPPPRPPASLRLDPISARPPGEGIWSVQIQKSNAKRCSPANPACTFYL